MTPDPTHTLGAITPEYAEAGGRVNPDDWHEVTDRAINGLSNYIREIDGKHEMGAGELAERIVRGWIPPSRLIREYVAHERQAAATAVLTAARNLCCGEHPSAHHAATDAHSRVMAIAERLADAARGA